MQLDFNTDAVCYIFKLVQDEIEHASCISNPVNVHDLQHVTSLCVCADPCESQGRSEQDEGMTHLLLFYQLPSVTCLLYATVDVLADVLAQVEHAPEL